MAKQEMENSAIWQIDGEQQLFSPFSNLINIYDMYIHRCLGFLTSVRQSKTAEGRQLQKKKTHTQKNNNRYPVQI